MLFTKRFEYNGINSAQYGLFFGHIDTDRLKKICGDVEYQTAYYGSQNRRMIHGIDYDSSPLSFDLEIISEAPISISKAKTIRRWLFHSPVYHKLYQSYADDKSIEKINGQIRRIYVECIFINPEELRYADGLHGWKCTCQLSSGMAFQEEVQYTYTDFSNNIVVNVESDYNDYLFPTLTIGSNSGSTPISIKNITDNNRTMVLKGNLLGNAITVDCALGMISNSLNIFSDGLEDMKFLRLLPEKNELEVTGVTSLSIRWQNLRYIV